MTASGRSAQVSRKLIFVNRYFDPDQSATSQMLTDLARGLAAQGHAVHVITSRQRYADAGARLPASEALYGVQVHRIATTRFGRARLIGRAIDYASFYVMCAMALLRMVGDHDVLVVKTDPPLLSILAAIIARIRRARFVTWQQDIFPEIATQLGANPLPRPLDALLRRLRDRSLRAARMNVTISGRMLQYLRQRGIPAARLCVIENWADADAIRTKAVGESRLRTQLGLGNQFVVGYSGNLGRAHDIDTLLSAAIELRADGSIVFLMIGGGAGMDRLHRAVAENGLGNFRFLPYQPRETLEDSLAAADVHLASLLPALEGLIMPSKLYGVLAAGRPLIFIGDADGDIARAVADGACGVTVPIGAGTGLAAQIRRLQSLPAERAAMGERARQMLVRRYSMQAGIARWSDLLGAVNASG